MFSYCVNAGGNYRLIFGAGTHLIVESDNSKLLLLLLFSDFNHYIFKHIFHEINSLEFFFFLTLLVK